MSDKDLYAIAYGRFKYAHKKRIEMVIDSAYTLDTIEDALTIVLYTGDRRCASI